MATNAVRYRHDGRIRWGLVDGRAIHPIHGDYPTTGSFIEEAAPGILVGDVETADPISVNEIDLLCPITTNQQFLCQAINYRSHMRESGFDPESSPFNIFFRKASSCLVPADSAIAIPAHVEFCDYEIEIGLVLRQSVTEPISVTQANLSDHVAGLVVVNDVSARDVQLAEGQFYKAKSYRTFGPVGPWLCLVDADDLARFDHSAVAPIGEWRDAPGRARRGDGAQASCFAERVVRDSRLGPRRSSRHWNTRRLRTAGSAKANRCGRATVVPKATPGCRAARGRTQRPPARPR